MSTVQSLSRGLQILEIMSKTQEGVGVTDLAKELKIDKSSVTRLMQTLVMHEFAAKASNSRRYILGPKVGQIVDNSAVGLPLKHQSMPILQELVEKTGENAHVAIYSQAMCLVVADIESPAQLRVVSGEGRLIPNHCTAIGKCLIAFGGHPIPKEFSQHTSRTISSRDQFKLHLDQIRERGYAMDDEEHEIGVRCVAAPVYDGGLDAVASMGISGPTVRVTHEKVPELLDIVKRCAHQLSELLTDIRLEDAMRP